MLTVLYTVVTSARGLLELEYEYKLHLCTGENIQPTIN